MRCFTIAVLSMMTMAVVVSVSTSVAADDRAFWPRFNGPNENNISSDTGLLDKWPEAGPRLVWKASDIGEGYAGVTIARGMIYTAGNVGRKMIVTALDMAGEMRWQVENGDAYRKSYPGSRGTPTIDGDRVYHESPTGQVVCLNAKTGKQIWTRNILDDFNGEEPRWGLAESVLIDGPRLICCPGGPKTAVVALDKQTGETVWQSPSADGDLAGYASPALVEYQGRRLILTMTEKALIGVDANNGRLLFRHPHPTRWEVNALMPVFHEGRILVSSGYGTTGSVMFTLSLAGKPSVAELWNSKDLDNHHGGIVLLDGRVYGAGHESGGENWVCLDWQSGKTLWTAKGIGKGSLTCADGLLYTMSENRDVGLVRPTSQRYELISQFELPRGGKGKTWAHPVVCGGRLYLRHGNFLYAYDVRK